MSGTTSAVDRIRAQRVVTILRPVPKVEAVVEALAAGGIRIVETTLDSDGALGTIERFGASPELTVLAGTVRTPADAETVESEARRLVAAVSSV